MPEDVAVVREGARVRVLLDAPKGNAITDGMVARLREIVVAVGPGTKLLTLESGGSDFSFGSSVDEHVPTRMPEVLPRFHALIDEWLRAPAVTAAIVAGRCLGGGFELALACDVIFAADDAIFGLPEIAIGAFPPVGSILLPLKIGGARASAAVLSGAAHPAQTWAAAGLIERVVPRPALASAVDEWYSSTIARYSAAALRRAAEASRLVVRRTVDAVLPQVERLYLDDLLKTADAGEGIAAFLEKRAPRWSDR